MLEELQQGDGIRFQEVSMDSATMKVHRYRGGQKGVTNQRDMESRNVDFTQLGRHH
jgi:hypothetical protein